jgi:putative tryptophan/tyrosine transport system substrate-binding protein
MRRREFITFIGGAVAWPVAARAQPTRVYRVGALLTGNADADTFRKELGGELRKAGYVEGQNLVLEIRSAKEELDRLPKLAAELVSLKVDVIVAVYTPCALAAKQATREIPIVMLAGDPLGIGLVPSLNRPGGNITGVSLMAAELSGKCVEIIHDLLPSVQRIAVLGNANDPFSKPFLEQVKLAGKNTGVEIAPVIMVVKTEEFDDAFSAMIKERASAVIVQASLSLKDAAELALLHHLPAVSVPRAFPELGGLLSYGLDGPDTFRRSGDFVTKILRGANPAEMPVEQPTKFELVINLKTARALSLSIPGSFLMRADQVIE